MTLLYGILILILLGGSAFFSASEMALSASNRMRLSAMAEDGNRGAARALRLLDKYDDALSTILIGNNLCNIGSDSLATVFVMGLLGSHYNGLWATITTIVMTVIVIIFCESAPKIAAKKNANRWSMALAGIINGLRILLFPIVALVKLLIWVLTLPFKGESHEDSEEEAAAELQSTIETAEDEGVIDEDVSELLLSALDFSENMVMNVMTARVDMQALDIDDDWHSLLLEEEIPFSRIPVYEDSIDHIIGILFLNRFARALLDNPNPNVRDYLMQPLYLYKTTKLPDALEQFQKSQMHLAIVTDEFGGTLGLVTLEDVLEQIVGEIWDETDQVENDVVERPGGRFEIDGDLPISEFAELLDLSEEDLETESATAGGFTIEKFEAFPRKGQTISTEHMTIKVLEMSEDGRRVEKILVRPILSE